VSGDVLPPVDADRSPLPPPADDPYASAGLVRTLAARGVPADAVARYRTQHDAAHRVLDADGAPRVGRRRWVVPGRIEVLGKHTDYAGGRSLLCTVERGLVIVSAPRDDRQVVVHDAVRQGRNTFDLTRPESLRPTRGWPLYPGTVARRFLRNFGDAVTGATIAMASGLPSSAGMSSSSALTVGIALALAEAGRLAEHPAWQRELRDRPDLAGYLGAVENGLRFRALEGDSGVGTMGGAQDHTAILCSRERSLVQFAWAPPTLERVVPWPAELVFAVAVSGVVASKAGAVRARYNRAARTVAHLLRHWNLRTHRHDGTLRHALQSAADASARLRDIARAEATVEFPAEHLVRRLDQFEMETEVLVPGAADALARGDLARFGDLVARSQAAAEAALENQVAETVDLVRLARTLGAPAASAFGAGFGGSVWAVVPADRADTFLAAWREAYIRAHPLVAARASWLLTRPAPPALEIPTDGAVHVA
jgi:galactokinase